jgi:hypothetical protein
VNSELNFRERYGIELAGIWREGETVGADLADERLQIGDALLLLGPRDRLQLLDSDSDFLVLTPLGRKPPDTRRAPVAAAIMLGVVVSVLLGYAPISIAAVVGGSIMVLTGCLSMEQAYRAIDWRAIFLIAGMLPLGTAMQSSGAATYIADQVMTLLGDAGPARRCRTVARHHGALHRDRDGYDDHSDCGPGGTHVADRPVSHVRHGLRTGNGHDGDRNGCLGKFHEPDISSCQHPCNGSGRISICRLSQSRRTADHRRFYRGNDIVALLLAAAARLKRQYKEEFAGTPTRNCRSGSRCRTGRSLAQAERLRR